jgi:transposase
MSPYKDHKDELREARDIWPLLEPHLDQAAADARRRVMLWKLPTRMLEAKFRKGEAEHGRDWLDRDMDWLIDQLVEELVDLVVYSAMLRARWQADVIAFETNRDPGDEADS